MASKHYDMSYADAEKKYGSTAASYMQKKGIIGGSQPAASQTSRSGNQGATTAGGLMRNAFSGAVNNLVGKALGSSGVESSQQSSSFWQDVEKKYGAAATKYIRSKGILQSPEEQLETSTWLEKFKDYDSQMRGLGSYLNSDAWINGDQQQRYKDMVDGYLKELAVGINGMSEDNQVRGYATKYYQYFRQMKDSLQKKEDFYSQFQDEDQYNGYRTASRSQQAAKGQGKTNDQWYEETAADLEAKQKRVKDLQQQLNNLAGSRAVYEDGIYMGEDSSADDKISALQRQLQQAQRELSTAQTTSRYAEAWRYSDVSAQKGFTGISARGLRQFEKDREERERQEQEQYDKEYNAFLQGGSGDVAFEQNLFEQLRSDTAYREPQESWTDEQRNTFGYLYATDKEKAYSYAQSINDTEAARQRMSSEQKVADWAAKNLGTGAVSFAAGVATMPFALADYLDYAVEYAARGTVTQRANMSAADIGNTMTGAVAEKLNEKGSVDTKFFGKVGWGDAYQLGVSIAQSVVGGHVLGAAGTAAAFFGSAAKQGYEDAKARGVSDGRALAFGLASGLAEAGCEYVSLDKLLSAKTPTNFKQLLVNTLLQAGVEGSEEGLTTLCNTVADAWINGDKSEIETNVQEYMSQGMSRSAAEQRAMKEWLQGIASDVMGGAISGGISTGAELGVRSATRYQGNSQELVEQGLRTEEGSAAYNMARDYAGQLGMTEEQAEAGDGQSQDRDSVDQSRQKPRRLSTMQADRLAEAIEAEDTRKIANAAQARLEALGVKENASGLAKILAKEASGEQLTRAEEYVLSRSKQAGRVREEMNSDMMREEVNAAIRGENYGYERSNDWAKNIGTARINADVYNGDAAESFRELLKASKARGNVDIHSQAQVDGQSQSIDGLVFHDGKLQLKTQTASGEVRYSDPGSVQIADPNLAEFVQELSSGKFQNAPAMYNMYERGQDIGEYITAWNYAENVYGYTASKTTVERAAQDPAIKGVLTDTQLRTAFDLGRSRREQERANRSSAQADESTEGQEQTNEGRLTQGSVSFEGGTVNGVTYQAVDQNKLNARQKKQVEALTMFAEATGVDIVFFQSTRDKSGNYQGANGLYADGKIYLDVNAGLMGRNNGQIAIVRTAGHELTHYIQDFAPELYEDLKTFLVDHLLEWQGKSISQLVDEKLARDRTGTLDYDGALDEVVADGCEMMLKRSSVVETMARENRGLFDRIHDWLQRWASRIKEAFAGVDAYHEEAKAMLDYMDQLQGIWDRALERAARNAAANGENKTAATEDGRVQMEEREQSVKITKGPYATKGDKRTAAFILSEHIEELKEMKSVADLTGKEMNDRSKDLPTQIMEFFESVGGKVSRKGLGDVILGDYGVGGIMSHRPINRAKMVTLVSVPQVIRDGRIINYDPNWKGRGYPSLTIAAPVSVAGTTVYVAAVIDQRGGYKFYLNECVDSEGNYIRITEDPTDNTKSGVTAQDGVTRGSDGSSDISIRESSEKSNNKIMDQKIEAEAERKSKVQAQERDFAPTERELLLEAATKRKAAPELKEYSKKVYRLETLQQKLERQQELLSRAEDESDRRALRKYIVKTEQQIRNAENALTKMEAGAVLKREANKAMAAWRDENPNAAAETIRRLRQANRALQRDVEYFRKEARRSTSGNRSVRPDDVRRLARTMIKELNSGASLESIERRLQELGDYIVNENADGTEVMRKAREIAWLLVDTATYEEDNSADLRREIRSYLKSNRLQISDELRGDMKDELDWFRKHNMGTLVLAKDGMPIDVAYQELGEMFGEGLFPSDVTAHADQLNQILDTLQGLEPTYHQMFSRYEQNEAAAILTNQIVDRLISGDVRQSSTQADRSYQAAIQRAENAEARAKDAEKRADDIQRTASFDRRAALQNLRRDMARRQEARQKRINIDRVAKRLGKYLTENTANKHVPEEMKKAIGEFLLSIDLAPGGNGKEARKYAQRMRDILDVVIRQNKYLSGETDSMKGGYLDLPSFLDEEIMQHLEELKDAQPGEVYDVKSMPLEQLTELEEILTAISTAVTTANDLLAGERGAKVSALGEQTIVHLDGMGRAKNMKDAERVAHNFLQFQNTTPYYFFKRFGRGGQLIFKEMQAGWGKLAFNSRDIIEFAEKTYTSKEAEAAEQTLYTFQLHKRLLENEDGDALRSKTREAVQLSKAQIMELYALSQREQALGHLLGAGIRIGEIKPKKGRTIQQADNYLLDLNDLNEITGKLTERDKAIVDALQKYMNTVGSDWGNEVSMARFGIRQFTEEHYWPIRTDSRTRPVRDPGMDTANLFRLLNMDFTKATIPNAHNAVVLGSAFDTFANHMADMAKYNALGLPLLDAMKWFSYSSASEMNQDGQYTTTSVQKSAERAFGPEAQKYFTTFMKDMNGTHEGGRGEELGSKWLSNYKVASVAGNLRVALLQPTAYVRAAAILDPKYLKRGLSMSNKQGRDEAMKHAGMAVWKDFGFYDTNINAGLREMIKHTDTTRQKIQEATMKGAEWGDKLTWGSIWNACKAEVQEKQKLSGEALMKATAERFDEIVYRTQVVDSTMTRSHNMRQKGLFAGMNTAFMSEPTLSYNMLLDAYNEFRDEWRRTGNRGLAWQKTKGYVGRCLAAYVATAVAASIVESLVDAARDDDEFQSYAEKWLEAQFGGGKLLEGNLIADLNPFNKLPYLKEIDSMLTGYDSTSRMDTAWIVSSYKAARILAESTALALGWQDEPTKVTYNGNMGKWGKLYNVLKAASQLTGLPGGNLGREVVTIWNNTGGLFMDRKIKTYDPGREKSIQYAVQDGFLTEDEAVRLLMKTDFDGDEKEARQRVYEWGLGDEKKYDAILAAAKSGDQAAFDSAMQTLQDYGYSEKGIRSAVSSAVKSWYQEEHSVDKQEAIKLLQTFAGAREGEAKDTVQKWTALVTDGISYDKIGEEFLEGNISSAKAAELYRRYGSMSEKDAEAKVLKLQCEKDTGINYDDIDDTYIDGDLTEEQAVQMRMKYGGSKQEDAERTVRQWSCERDTGIKYDDIQEAYTEGRISQQQAQAMLESYGGKDEDTAAAYIMKYDFVDGDDELADISITGAVHYFVDVQSSGMSKAMFYEAYKGMTALESDKDENGNTVRNSLMKKTMAYIDSLRLSTTQKDALFLCFYSEKKLKSTPWH